MGYQFRSGIEPDAKGSHYFLQIRDFDEKREQIAEDGLIRITPRSVAENQVLRETDIVFMAKGVHNFAKAVGNLPNPCLAASYFFVFRPDRALLPEYLAWHLNQRNTRRYIARMATVGANMPVVRREVLERLEIPLPDPPDQEKIVKLDRLAKRQHALLLELAEQKQRLATAACQSLSRHSIPFHDDS